MAHKIGRKRRKRRGAELRGKCWPNVSGSLGAVVPQVLEKGQLRDSQSLGTEC